MQKASKDDLASALVWTARQMPAPVVKTMVEMYLAAEAEAFLASRRSDAREDAD